MSVNSTSIFSPLTLRPVSSAGLLYGDFPNELIPALSKKGKVSADIQGFLRHNENGLMNFHDWKDKLTYLPYFDFLKTDAAEAEILTGLTDRRAAAKQLYEWGAKEILISHNSEMLVYDRQGLLYLPGQGTQSVRPYRTR